MESKPTKIFPNLVRVGDILSWAEVSVIHKSRNGIYQKKGRLVSLLTDFGKINQCYPDFYGSTSDTIFYTGAGRRGNQKLDVRNKALTDAIQTGHTVPLFCKLGVNRWQFVGYWYVTDAQYIHDESQHRMVWKFTLKKAAVDEL